MTLLCNFYDNQSSRNEISEVTMSRQRVVIDRFVNLLCAGYVLPVLEFIARMYEEARIDVSLVRYFGVEVLDSVGAPYSDEFITSMLPIVTKTESKRNQSFLFLDNSDSLFLQFSTQQHSQSTRMSLHLLIKLQHLESICIFFIAVEKINICLQSEQSI